MWGKLQGYFESRVELVTRASASVSASLTYAVSLATMTGHVIGRTLFTRSPRGLSRILSPERLKLSMQAEWKKGNSTFSEAEKKARAHSAQTGPPCSPAKSEDVLEGKGTLYWNIYWKYRSKRIWSKTLGGLVLLWWTTEELCKVINLVQTMYNQCSTNPNWYS